jgi:hypothetical protein
MTRVIFKARDGFGADQWFGEVADGDEEAVKSEVSDFATIYGGTDVKLVVFIDDTEIEEIDVSGVDRTKFGKNATGKGVSA